MQITEIFAAKGCDIKYYSTTIRNNLIQKKTNLEYVCYVK